MPDGKRNSLTVEDETDGVNSSFYEEDNIQKLTSSPTGKRLPLNISSRGLNNLSDRLLRAMVANEIKKTLDAEDNKKLVANHRPVLHCDNEQSNGETDNMIVVGVVLTSKQTQNEEVSKALDLLRRNGVSCVCFSLKDSQSPPNGTKKDGGISPDENTSLPIEELSSDSPEAEKKVSSPTVSTTSDYASPPSPSPPQQDTSCTSTTSPIPVTDGGVAKELFSGNSEKITENDKVAVKSFVGPPTLSPKPPVLFPQAPSTAEQILDPLRGEKEEGGLSSVLDEESEVPLAVQQKIAADNVALRRKKRRRRLYPYVSRRKSKSKKKKVQAKSVILLPAQTQEEESKLDEKGTNQKDKSCVAVATVSELEEKSSVSSVSTTIVTSTTIPEKKVDPYEFDDSDLDGNEQMPLDTFKTPIGRSPPKKVAFPKKKETPSILPSPKKGSTGKVSKKKGGKKVRSPRKKLTFSKNRSFSPDITDHGTSTRSRRGGISTTGGVKDEVDIAKNSSSSEYSSTDSCVQPISAVVNEQAIDTNTIADVKKANEKNLVLLHSQRESQLATTSLSFPPLPLCDDSDIRVDKKGTLDKSIKVSKRDTATLTPNLPVAQQQPSNVQIKEDSTTNENNEFLVPPRPSDSLQDSPDSMQLRRSSFYSSISRNVRTNLENYLDGRPPDLKPPKRSKKFKTNFLLHHGDNFPDDPEAPYKLHLATQVLLKLNKRRVKCKPKEEKGKSLLSYLKLQPKRVSRVSKHSLKSDDGANVSSTGEPTTSVFSGEWTVSRKYICNICGQVETAFWDMVMHKGEVHPGIVVTHVELSNDPPEGFRNPPSPREEDTLISVPPPCTKCGTTFTSNNDLHLHIFECAGNASALQDATKVVTTNPVNGKKKKGKRKRGFKRRINGLPKKNANAVAVVNNNTDDKPENTEASPPESIQPKSAEIAKRRNSEVFNCEFCSREFKTEGWLKNHVSLSHSLPISIPLEKLSLPIRASISSSRRFSSTQQLANTPNTKSNKKAGRET